MSSSFSPSTSTTLRPSTTNTCLRGLKDYRSYSLLRITALSSPPLCSARLLTPILLCYQVTFEVAYSKRTDTMLPATAFLLLLLATSAGAASMRAMRTTAGGCAPPFTCVSIVDVPAPVPKPRREIVIKVQSSSVNPRCVWMKIWTSSAEEQPCANRPTHPASYTLPFSRHTKYAC